MAKAKSNTSTQVLEISEKIGRMVEEVHEAVIDVSCTAFCIEYALLHNDTDDGSNGVIANGVRRSIATELCRQAEELRNVQFFLKHQLQSAVRKVVAGKDKATRKRR